MIGRDERAQLALKRFREWRDAQLYWQVRGTRGDIEVRRRDLEWLIPFVRSEVCYAFDPNRGENFVDDEGLLPHSMIAVRYLDTSEAVEMGGVDLDDPQHRGAVLQLLAFGEHNLFETTRQTHNLLTVVLFGLEQWQWVLENNQLPDTNELFPDAPHAIEHPPSYWAGQDVERVEFDAERATSVVEMLFNDIRVVEHAIKKSQRKEPDLPPSLPANRLLINLAWVMHAFSDEEGRGFHELTLQEMNELLNACMKLMQVLASALKRMKDDRTSLQSLWCTRILGYELEPEM